MGSGFLSERQCCSLSHSSLWCKSLGAAGCAAQVWEEGVSSEAGAVRLFAPEIVGSLVEGLSSAQWARKKASAEAVVHLTKVSVGSTGMTDVHLSV